MNARDISVAVLAQSGRSDNLLNPLQTTAMDVAVDPADPYARDIVIVETPNREMAYEVLKKPLHGAQVIFRMRGNAWYGIDKWIDSRLKSWLARRVVLPGVDGCLAICPAHARLFESKTGVPAGVAKLPVYPDRWPTTEHVDGDLRILSLTNADYRPKIHPLIDAMPVVNDVLADVGGEWRIGGDGLYADRLQAATEAYDHIDYRGYVDAHDAFEWANVLVHLSNLDGWPNAICEAMASRLPAVTNDHAAFVDEERPNLVARSHGDLREQLRRLTDPDRRAELGQAGLRYIRAEHSDEAIGERYVAYCRRLLWRQGIETEFVPTPETATHDR